MSRKPLKKQTIDWHRLFGLTLWSFFQDSPFEVELEKDLSSKRQLLDVIIVRKRPGTMIQPLPDGLEDLAEHNLITYKSLQEPLDAWALQELTGHYVNYRKQVSPSWKALLPEESFHLIAVSTRFPRKLSAQMELPPLRQGVYEVRQGIAQIRIIVLSEIPQKARNVPWHLFSGNLQLIDFAKGFFLAKNPEISRIVYQIFKHLSQKGIPMAYTMEDFNRDFVKDNLDLLSPEEVLQHFSAQERLSGLSSEERLSGLSSEERLNELSSEEVLQHFSTEELLKGLSSEEMLKGMAIEEIEAYLKQNAKNNKR